MKLMQSLLHMLILVRVSLAGCISDVLEPSTIHCDLRILDFRRNSSEVPGIKTAQRLNVQCSDVFFFESQLRSDHFGSLPHLNDLSITYCKIR
jgi:hypothetical protein